MYPKIRHITIDCTGDPYYLARFWNTVLGWPLSDDDKPGDPEALLTDPDGTAGLLFIQVPEGKTVKNRIHFDLQPPVGRTRDEEVERVLGLGARMLDDRRGPCGRGWVVFADPEGNEFCVETSMAEYEKFDAESAQPAGPENEG
jgi:predicted enzyme related to lactoylglutathione lyase